MPTLSFLLYTAVRAIVVLALAYASVVAFTHWAVQSRRIEPFGTWARFVRRLSDPLLQPLERRILRGGGNPQNAPYWLLGIVIGGGLVLLSFTMWLVELVARLQREAARTALRARRRDRER